MRTVSSEALAALQGSIVPMALLVEMDLDAPLFLNTSGVDLTLGGVVYYGTKGLGSVGAVRDTAAEVAQLQFELSGVTSEIIATALGTTVQGKPVRIKVAIFDPATYQVLDQRLRWAGILDVMAISDGPDASVIRVSAEHCGIDLLRPGGSIYSDAEQRRLYPGDPSLQFMADQVDQRVVWPAASWGRK